MCCWVTLSTGTRSLFRSLFRLFFEAVCVYQDGLELLILLCAGLAGAHNQAQFTGAEDGTQGFVKARDP